jgi:hypothetical protein
VVSTFDRVPFQLMTDASPSFYRRTRRRSAR